MEYSCEITKYVPTKTKHGLVMSRTESGLCRKRRVLVVLFFGGSILKFNSCVLIRKSH